MRWQVPRVTKEHRLHLPLPATECWQSTMKGVQFELRVQGLISAISQPDPPLLICRLRRLISGLPSPLRDPTWVERQWAWMVDEKEMLALSWPAVKDHWRQLHIWAPRAPPTPSPERVISAPGSNLQPSSEGSDQNLYNPWLSQDEGVGCISTSCINAT